MTKLLFLADLHGNMTATLAMEQELERIGADEIYFLGDAIGKGPESDKTCDWVQRNCDHFIGGNWDYWVSNEPDEKNMFFRNQLGEDRMQWLRSLPREMELTMSGIHFRLLHGRPVSDLIYSWDSEEKLATLFEAGDRIFNGVIYGDSHRPFQREMKKGYVINTGQPSAYLMIISWRQSLQKKFQSYWDWNSIKKRF